MPRTYWSQWNHEEIMSMHGIENDIESNLCHDEVDTYTIYEEPVDYLEFSWRDFM